MEYYRLLKRFQQQQLSADLLFLPSTTLKNIVGLSIPLHNSFDLDLCETVCKFAYCGLHSDEHLDIVTVDLRYIPHTNTQTHTLRLCSIFFKVAFYGITLWIIFSQSGTLAKRKQAKSPGLSLFLLFFCWSHYVFILPIFFKITSTSTDFTFYSIEYAILNDTWLKNTDNYYAVFKV